MKVVLNTNGILSKYYRWYYKTTELPENLCPYFWRLLYAIIMMPFAFIEAALVKILLLIDIREPGRLDNRIFGPIISTIIMYCILYLILVILSMFIFPFMLLFGYRLDPEGVQIAYFIGNSAIVGYVFSLIFAIYRINQFRIRHMLKENNDTESKIKSKTKYNSLMISMIKASYKKICPKIEWK